jgi:hypothetical protein
MWYEIVLYAFFHTSYKTVDEVCFIETRVIQLHHDHQFFKFLDILYDSCCLFDVVECFQRTMSTMQGKSVGHHRAKLSPMQRLLASKVWEIKLWLDN